MSGYRHSGLTQEDYEDREALRAAAEVIERRWRSSALLLLIREVLGEIEREGF